MFFLEILNKRVNRKLEFGVDFRCAADYPRFLQRLSAFYHMLQSSESFCNISHLKINAVEPLELQKIEKIEISLATQITIWPRVSILEALHCIVKGQPFRVWPSLKVPRSKVKGQTTHLNGVHAHLLCSLEVPTEVIQEHCLTRLHSQVLQGQVIDISVWLS